MLDEPTLECTHAQWLLIFDFTENSIDCKQLCYKLNRILPRDVAVTAAYPVNNELHARFSATSRTYHYYMHHARNPFQKAYSCEMPYALNYNQMNEAASYLIGERDFKCFCKAGGDNKTTICNLTEHNGCVAMPNFPFTTIQLKPRVGALLLLPTDFFVIWFEQL